MRCHSLLQGIFLTQGSPGLQADSLGSQPPGKPICGGHVNPGEITAVTSTCWAVACAPCHTRYMHFLLSFSRNVREAGTSITSLFWMRMGIGESSRDLPKEQKGYWLQSPHPVVDSLLSLKVAYVTQGHTMISMDPRHLCLHGPLPP